MSYRKLGIGGLVTVIIGHIAGFRIGCNPSIEMATRFAPTKNKRDSKFRVKRSRRRDKRVRERMVAEVEHYLG
jgi:hypothetical protein